MFAGVKGFFKSVSAVATDAYFNLVTLLLPGNGTNGAQNNTFLDSSTNNFTITRNGNTTQGTFSPFSQTGWGNYLDGSGDYFVIGSAGNWNFLHNGSSFSVEFYVYRPNLTACEFMATILGSGDIGINLGFLSNGQIRWQFINSGSVGELLSTVNVSANTWAFVQILFNGSTKAMNMYIDGQAAGNFTFSSYTFPTSNSTYALHLGDRPPGLGTTAYTGYISCLRLSDTTRSSGVPSAPLTSDGNTKLLTCQYNRFRDASSNAYAITVNGNPSVQAFSPFAPTAAYSAATVGGSGYFDGTGDYLTAPNNTALDLSSGDFTVELWFYPTQANQSGAIVNRHNGNYGSGNDFQFGMYMSTGSFVVRPYQGTADFSITVGTPQRNGWNHAAFVRTGNTFYGFLNGVRSGTSQTITGALNNSTWATYIGAALSSSAGNDFFTGYMGGVRITKGGALYTGSTYTVPTDPFTTTVSSGTVSLLTNFTNAGITDATAKNVLETVGNAQISTTQSKFGGSSMYFDGTGDWLVIPSSPNTTYGSGDFTIEFWVYTATANQSANIFDQRSTATQITPVIYLNSGSLVYYVNASNVINGGSLPTSQWNHVAVARSGTSTKMFLNGTQTGSTYTDSNVYVSSLITIGAYSPGGTSPFTGYIDDLRITKGYARYTANFTPPTAAFALQ